MIQSIDGALLRRMILSGAHNIQNHLQEVNALNVFPVPDGDTGTNMSLTINAAARELSEDDSTAVGEVAQKAANALLRGARGNSGVILSILFRGFAKGLKGLDEANAAQFAAGWNAGQQAAYKAVMKPTEGTILTVARVAFEYGVQQAEQCEDLYELFAKVVGIADQTLEQTPEMLPVLKQAGVVDAGAKGLLYILEGVLQVLQTGEMIELTAPAEPAAQPQLMQAEVAVGADFGSFETGDIQFSYCTEFIVMRENQKDPATLRRYLESIGDCVLVLDDEEVIKIHVHTNHPGKAFERGLLFGSLTSMKVDNMKIQHAHKVLDTQPAAKPQPEPAAPAEPEKDYGFVVVCSGEGIAEVFRELGADQIVTGGQTMNPSTQDILQAVSQVPARTVFVLPNNKNIIMAAQQAAEISPTPLVVLESKTIPQGVSAMLQFDPEADVAANTEVMSAALATVHTGQITYAARDSAFDGQDIREGQILGLLENKLVFTELDLTDTLLELCGKMTQEGGEFVTVYYGEDILPEQAEKDLESLKARLPAECEVTLINGGQPVYYYLISVE